MITSLTLAAVYKTSHYRIDFNNITIVDSSKYNLDMGDYVGPGMGGYILACGVRDALEDSENDNSYFYVTVSFFPYKKFYEYPVLEAMEKRRLSALGLCVFYSDLWTFSGEEREHTYYKALTGLLTKEQLLNFPACNEYGYFFDWVTNAGYLRAVPDLEKLDEICREKACLFRIYS